jgi:carbamoyltransferase
LGLLFSRPRAPWGVKVQESISCAPNHFRLLRRLLDGRGVPLVSFEHHLCHAASAYYSSDFDRALILTLDESGDMWSGLVGLGEGDELRVLRPLPFPNSLGWIFSSATGMIGFRPRHDEHKTQWLSQEGSPEFIAVFRKLLVPNADGFPILNPYFLEEGPSGRPGFSPAFYRELGFSSPSPCADRSARASVARSVQDFLEETVIAWAENYRKKTGAKYLCVAGGVFLNVLLVRALEKRAGFAKVFVQPVSGNPGSALGAACLGRKLLSGHSGRRPLVHLDLGPSFEAAQIKPILDNCKIVYRHVPDEEELLGETIRLLQAGKIVAWYQGRMEFGLRALGNRSILASPFSPYVTENLNRYIKHREDFHPFALSVPAENAGAHFDCTANCRFLASTGALTGSLPELQLFTFRGREVRVHTVECEANPRYHRLLRKFGETAPAPILINTSFNLFGEPLVCDPREAVRSFYCAGIDALVMGNFIVVK